MQGRGGDSESVRAVAYRWGVPGALGGVPWTRTAVYEMEPEDFIQELPGLIMETSGSVFISPIHKRGDVLAFALFYLESERGNGR